MTEAASLFFPHFHYLLLHNNPPQNQMASNRSPYLHVTPQSVLSSPGLFLCWLCLESVRRLQPAGSSAGAEPPTDSHPPGSSSWGHLPVSSLDWPPVQAFLHHGRWLPQDDKSHCVSASQVSAVITLADGSLTKKSQGQGQNHSVWNPGGAVQWRSSCLPQLLSSHLPSHSLLMPFPPHRKCLDDHVGVRPFVTLWTVACQSPPSMGFSRQEYWNGLPCPPPGDLPDPGIKPTSFMSLALAGGFFTTSATWDMDQHIWIQINISCDCSFPSSYHLTLLPFITSYLYYWLIDLAALSLSCDMWDLQSFLWHEGFLVVGCGLSGEACGI